MLSYHCANIVHLLMNVFFNMMVLWWHRYYKTSMLIIITLIFLTVTQSFFCVKMCILQVWATCTSFEKEMAIHSVVSFTLNIVLKLLRHAFIYQSLIVNESSSMNLIYTVTRGEDIMLKNISFILFSYSHKPVYYSLREEWLCSRRHL